MRTEAIKLVQQLEQAFHDVVVYIQETENNEGGVKDVARNADLEELCDYLYAFREMHDIADNIRKEAHKRIEWLQKFICVLYVRNAQNAMEEIEEDFEKAKTAGIGEPIRTEWCTCTPKIEYSSTPPHPTRDPVRYKLLMEALDMPPVMFKHELFKANWKAMQEYLTQQLEQGNQLPEGLDHDKLMPVYKVTLRKQQPLIVRDVEGDGKLKPNL